MVRRAPPDYPDAVRPHPAPRGLRPALIGGVVLGRLRWLTILLPAILVVAIELVSDSVLDPAFPVPLDTLLIAGVVLASSAVFSHIAFGRLDALAAELSAQNSALEARNARAAALHRVSVAITSLADLDEILGATVAHARDLLGADAAALALTEVDGSLALRATAGPSDAFLTAAADVSDVFDLLRPDVAVSRLASPLQRGGETIGALAVASSTDRSFSIDDVETLSSLAIQAAIAIENDRLQRSLRELAVHAERERIAREMHDGLAQVLGYVNTKSQAVTELLAAGRTAEAQAQLDELAAAARSVYVDVREAILALRTPIPPSMGLADALDDLGRRFGEASKVVVVVAADDAARALKIPPEVAAQLYRIVQEALTNVRKHAAARRVWIEMSALGATATIVIRDDGRGFEVGAGDGRPDGGDWPRYGLAAMRERAASIGGSVTWSPASEGGTEVRIEAPLRPVDDGRDRDRRVTATIEAGDRVAAGPSRPAGRG